MRDSVANFASGRDLGGRDRGTYAVREGAPGRRRGRRNGLRPHLLKQQAAAGDIVLLYGDESEARTHPSLARAGAKTGADLPILAPGQAQKVAILAACRSGIGANLLSLSEIIGLRGTGAVFSGRVDRSKLIVHHWGAPDGLDGASLCQIRRSCLNSSPPGRTSA